MRRVNQAEQAEQAEVFKLSIRGLLLGEYNRFFLLWFQSASVYASCKGWKETVLKLVQTQKFDILLEDGLELKDEYVRYFDTLIAWIFDDEVDRARTCFDQLIAEARPILAADNPIGPIRANAINNRAYMRENNHSGGHDDYYKAIYEARPLYDLGIKAGSAAAMYNRARLNHYERPDETFRLYERATREGCAISPCFLAEIYYRSGAWSYLPEAIYFCDLSIGRGNISAREVRVRFEPGVRSREEEQEEYRTLRVGSLLDLMWDELLDNPPLVPETKALLIRHPHFITKKLMEIDDLSLLRRVIEEGHIIHEILRTDKPSLTTRFFISGETGLEKVEEHCRCLEIMQHIC